MRGVGVDVRVCQAHAGIERTDGTRRAAADDVRIDHRRTDIFVTKELLDRANVLAVLEEMSREAMTERMARDWFGDARGQGSLSEGALNRFLMQVPAHLHALSANLDVPVGREDELPRPLSAGIGILAP